MKTQSKNPPSSVEGPSHAGSFEAILKHLRDPSLHGAGADEEIAFAAGGAVHSFAVVGRVRPKAASILPLASIPDAPERP
jgi:hypothetical protein